VGERLTPQLVEWKDWPEASVEAGYVDIAQTPEALTGMAGTMARYEIFAGEPVREEKLVRSAQGYLPAILEEGVRAVSVTVGAGAASGGFIGPNDHVDVVLTHPPSRDEMSSGKLLSNTILYNVRVLALNGQLGRAPSEDNPDQLENGAFSGSAMATLALDPDQAKVIIHASAVGNLSLVLRSIGDFSEEKKTEQAGTNAAIRISSPFWNG
jgi:pilus assembly protein CpaB